MIVVDWIYKEIYLEHSELLFIISLVIIFLIIVITCFLAHKTLKESYANK